MAARAGNYAMLRFSIDTADPAIGALMQRVQEKSTAIETNLLFFELEWAALEDERAEELLAADGIETARHFLRSARRYRPYLLSEAEEKILAEKSVTGGSAWGRLFSEQISAVTVELPGEDEPRDARQRARAPDVRRPRGAPHDGRAGHRRAAARPAHARASSSTRCCTTRRSTTGCASTRTGSPRATSPTRRPTSPCRRC